jgi:hypothetical protein
MNDGPIHVCRRFHPVAQDRPYDKWRCVFRLHVFFVYCRLPVVISVAVLVLYCDVLQKRVFYRIVGAIPSTPKRNVARKARGNARLIDLRLIGSRSSSEDAILDDIEKKLGRC